MQNFGREGLGERFVWFCRPNLRFWTSFGGCQQQLQDAHLETTHSTQNNKKSADNIWRKSNSFSEHWTILKWIAEYFVSKRIHSVSDFIWHSFSVEYHRRLASSPLVSTDVAGGWKLLQISTKPVLRHQYLETVQANVFQLFWCPENSSRLWRRVTQHESLSNTYCSQYVYI